MYGRCCGELWNGGEASVSERSIECELSGILVEEKLAKCPMLVSEEYHGQASTRILNVQYWHHLVLAAYGEDFSLVFVLRWLEQYSFVCVEGYISEVALISCILLE